MMIEMDTVMKNTDGWDDMKTLMYTEMNTLIADRDGHRDGYAHAHSDEDANLNALMDTEMTTPS